jgi:parallel beta-helix repeat protein
MSRTINIFFVLSLSLVLTVGVWALTSTVDDTMTTAQIQTAIDSVLASSDITGEVVFTAGTYLLDASLAIVMNSDGAITVRSSTTERPVIVCANYLTGGSRDGAFSFDGTDTTLTFQNLIIIPPNVPGQEFANTNTTGIGGRDGLANVTLNIIDVLMTGNDGTNTPAGLDGMANPTFFPNITRFQNACVNLFPQGANANTMVLGATRMICSMARQEGFYQNSNVAANTGWPKSHFYNCVFTYNGLYGLRIRDVGDDDRYYDCVFNWNGGGDDNQGVANRRGFYSSDRPLLGGGSSYFENCTASHNAERGFYIGREVKTRIYNCTAEGNGNFFATAEEDAIGIDVDGVNLDVIVDGVYCNNNRGAGLQVTPGSAVYNSTVTVRNAILLNTAVQSLTPTSGSKAALELGGQEVLVENIVIQDCSAMAIWYDDVSAGTTNLTIRNVAITNAGMTGILVYGTAGASNSVIEDVTLINTGNDPLWATTLSRASAISVRNPGLNTNGSFTLRNAVIDTVPITPIYTSGYGLWMEAETPGSGTVEIDNCNISNCERAGLSIEGGVISVTDVVVSDCDGSGIQVVSAAPLSMHNVDVFNSGGHGITIGNDGFAAPAIPISIAQMSEICAVDNATAGIRIFSNEINTPLWQLSDSTLLGNPIGFKMEANNFTSQPMEIVDSIIAGASDTGIEVTSIVTSAITVNTSALVEQGPYALDTPVVDITPAVVVLNGVVSADPIFVSVDRANADYLVVDNSAYGGQASGAGDLAGCSTYRGNVVSISNWRLY